jgi:hypothetical protein
MEDYLRRIEIRDENMHHHHHDAKAAFKVLKRFRSSVAFCRIVEFVVGLCEASKGKSIAQLTNPGPGVARILRILDMIEQTVARVEPVRVATRFGNPAFKVIGWFSFVLLEGV